MERSNELFPEKFDFFGIGKVEASSLNKNPDLSFDFIVFFKLQTEQAGFCAVAFEQKPVGEDQQSMAVEMANILVSKFASRLADEMLVSIELSPPELLQIQEPKHRRLLPMLQNAAANGINSRSYEFTSSENQKLGLRLTYLPTPIGQT